MEEVVGVATAFERSHQRLDVLLLNANAITQTHKVTPDGFESNLAVGFVGRALLSLRLRPLLERTPNAMVLGVVGLNLDRLDLEAPAAAPGFSGMRALGWWQWAAQVFSREWNRRVPGVPSNTYMPGLVRTKILANEPQPMRLLVQVVQVFMGIPVERGGEELVTAVEDARHHQRRDVYYARTRMKGPRDLKERPGDGAALWTRTERWLARWLPAA
jgi:NAD(P)-dependent dehydrogenase (short-subunit alcohol dehydrogenase family)